MTEKGYAMKRESKKQEGKTTPGELYQSVEDMTEQGRTIKETNKKYMPELKELAKIAEGMDLPGTVCKEILRDDIGKDDKIVGFIFDSMNKLSLAKAVLEDENLNNLDGCELAGVRDTVHEVFDLLDIASSLHCRTT